MSESMTWLQAIHPMYVARAAWQRAYDRGDREAMDEAKDAEEAGKLVVFAWMRERYADDHTDADECPQCGHRAGAHAIDPYGYGTNCPSGGPSLAAREGRLGTFIRPTPPPTESETDRG